MNAEKVFCIGFHKTGTKSLGQALERLGYRVCGPAGTRDPDIRKNVYTIVDSLLDQFDAFQDNPWPLVYQYVDKQIPGSKFILTVRPETEWFESVLDHFGSEDTPMRDWIYGEGHPQGNELRYISRYLQHNEQVTAYFRDREEDLLVMELHESFGWEKLCQFLDKPVPDSAFPHVNPKTNRMDDVI
jgi:hypothetical protein